MAYNHLNSMLRTIETKLNTTSNNNNYFESRIKQDLNIFKDQKNKTSFDSSFANGNEQVNQTQPAGRVTYITNTSPETNDEIRRAIKREIEPFIFTIKNELNITMDAFRKEIESYTNFKPDIDECKEITSSNTNLIRIIQEENDKKITANNQKMQSLSKQIDDIKQISNDTSNRLEELEKVFLIFNDKFSEFTNVKSQLEKVDTHLGSIYKEIEESLNNKLTSKYSHLENKIESCVKEYSSLKTQMATTSINQSHTQESLNEKQKHINTLFNELNEVKLKNNSTVVLINDTKNKIEQIKDYNRTLETNLANFNEQILNQNDNISTVQLGFKALANEQLQIKSQFSDVNKQVVKEQNQIVMFQNELEALSTSIKVNSDKLTKLSSQVNESSNNAESALYSNIIDKINKCQMNIDEVSDVSNGKLASINGKINELSINIKDLSTNKRQYGNTIDQQTAHLYASSPNSDANYHQDEQFKLKQIKVNDQYEMALNEIGKKVLTIEKDLKAIKRDNDVYEENFIKMQDNFNKIYPLLNEVALLPESIKTLSTNHSTLQNEVQKGFNSMTDWQNDLIANIDKTVANLKSECENQIQMVKISNTMNRVNVDSQRSDIDKEMITKAMSIETKLQLDKVNNRCDAIDKKIKDIEGNKIPQVYTYIDNTLKSLLELKSMSENRGGDSNRIDQLLYDTSNNKQKQLSPSSMREKEPLIDLSISNKQPSNIIIEDKQSKDRDKPDLNKKSMSPKQLSARVQEEINVYPSGYITNNLKGTILNGDGLDSSSSSPPFKQTETIQGMSKAKSSFYSSNNFIDLYYSKYGSSAKTEKNENYLSMQPVDLIQNESLFPNTYLKKFMIPRANLENILEIEFDGNIDSYKEEEGFKEDNHSGGGTGTGEYLKSENLFGGQSIEQQSQHQPVEKSKEIEKESSFKDDFDDDFDS